MRFIAALLLALLLLPSPAVAGFQELRDAARLGDTEAVSRLLAAGEDPNSAAYGDGYAPLQFAAGNGHVEMTRALLAAGADTEYRDHNGDRALLWAAAGGHAETVQLLLDAGSPPDADADPYGLTPLMRAARYGHTDVARLLVEAGADVDRIEQGGDTALHFAAATDDLELVRLLLGAGASPNIFDTILYETPLHKAAVWSTPAMIEVLAAAGAGTDARDDEGRTPLFVAALLGNAANVEALIRAYGDIDAADLAGTTPIEAAIDGIHGDAAERAATVGLLADYTSALDWAFAATLAGGYGAAALRLLERGAAVDAVDEDGRSALANSARMPGLTYFHLLLNRGADLARFGPETLLAAAALGRTDIVAALLERGVAVDSRDPSGATPLLLAAQNAHVETVRLLLAAGADKVAVDTLGFGVDAYFDIRPRMYEAIIEERAASRAYRPTDELEIDLERIRSRQAEIRKLLAENGGTCLFSARKGREAP